MANSFKDACFNKLGSLTKIGTSKHEEKDPNTYKAPGIYSVSTLKNYKDVAVQYSDWMAENHPDAHRIKYAHQQGYDREYIQSRIDSGKSPSTVARDTAALAKLHGCTSTDVHPDRPERQYKDFSRSRGFSEAMFNEIVNKGNRTAEIAEFCRSTGLREVELTHLRGEPSEIFHNGKLFLNSETCYTENKDGRHTCATKHGRPREVEILPQNFEVVEHFLNNADVGGYVCADAPPHLDIHGCRALYAADCYKEYARPIEEIKDSVVLHRTGRAESCVYWVRDGSHVAYDRDALKRVSRSLGHNRAETVADNYLRR